MPSRICLPVVLAVFLLMTASGQAQARGSFFQDLKDAFFGTDQAPEPDPRLTGVAPFTDRGADTDKTAENMGLAYENNGYKPDLDAPHRRENQIADWLTANISVVLETGITDYAEHLKAIETQMDSYAIADYQKFMQQTNILGRMQQERLGLHAFVEQRPFLLNEGAVGGRYRWLFEVPVTLTLLPEGSTTYRNMEVPPSYRLVLRVQVGRVNIEGDGMLIESFEARKNN